MPSECAVRSKNRTSWLGRKEGFAEARGKRVAAPFSGQVSTSPGSVCPDTEYLRQAGRLAAWDKVNYPSLYWAAERLGLQLALAGQPSLLVESGLRIPEMRLNDQGS